MVRWLAICRRPDRGESFGCVRWILGWSQPRQYLEVQVVPLSELKVKIFADGADVDRDGRPVPQPVRKGFHDNPSLMRRAGVTDYAQIRS